MRKPLLAERLATATTPTQWRLALQLPHLYPDDDDEVRQVLQAFRFWRHVERGPNADDCWLWRGPVNKRTGTMLCSSISKSRTAYRTAAQVAWELTYGRQHAITLYRTCGERLCIAPHHRRRSEPVSDGARMAAMAKLYEQGWTMEQIGNAFGLTRERVRQLIRPTEAAQDERIG